MHAGSLTPWGNQGPSVGKEGLRQGTLWGRDSPSPPAGDAASTFPLRPLGATPPGNDFYLPSRLSFKQSNC